MSEILSFTKQVVEILVSYNRSNKGIRTVLYITIATMNFDSFVLNEERDAIRCEKKAY